MAVGEDLRPCAFAADEGIVRRHRAVVAQPHDLAAEIGEVLRALHLVALAAGHVEQACAVEDDARAEMQAAGRARQGLEDALHAEQRIVAELGPRQHRRGAALALAGIGEIEHGVPREVGVQADVEQAALAARIDLGQAADRRPFEPAVGEDAQPARPLGDQQAAVGQEGHAPRLLEIEGQHPQAVGRLGAAQDLLGVRDRRGRPERRRWSWREGGDVREGPS